MRCLVTRDENFRFFETMDLLHHDDVEINQSERVAPFLDGFFDDMKSLVEMDEELI